MPFFNLNELSEKERKKYLQDLDNTAYNNSLQVREEEQKILNENINLPTREDVEKQSGANNSIFQAGAFSDGYQFGDIAKALGSTALSTFNNMVKGVSRLGEGISDWTSNRIADIVEATGDKENANRIRKNVLQNDTDNNVVTKTIKEATDKDTLLGEKGQNFVQQLSRTGFQAAIGAGAGVLGTAAATAATTGTTFISSSGSGEVEALNEQYNKAIKDGYNSGIEEYLNSEEGKKARGKSAIYGHLVGAIEAGTEAMFAGLGKATTAIGYGKSGLGLDDKIAKSLSNKVSSTLAKNLIQYGVKAGGESVEELVGGIGQAIAQKLTYKQDEGLGQLIKDQNIPEAMLSAFVSSAIMQAPGMYSTTKNGQDFMTGLNKTDTGTYEQLIETEQKDLIKKKAIENEYNNQIKENDYNDTQKQELLEQISKDYDEGKLLSPKLTTKEIEQSEDNARNMLEEIKRVESENETDTVKEDNEEKYYFNNYTEKEIENIEGKNIKIANNYDDIMKFVKSARSVPSNAKLYLSKITNDISTKIKKMFGINVDNYNISISTDFIRHTFSHHGNADVEAKRGQVQIVEDDFKNIPQIIQNPDNIIDGGYNKQNKKTIKFEKNIDGNVVVATYVSDKRNNLELQTMYKFKNKKINPVTAANEFNNSLVRTSKTTSDTDLFNKNISQNELESQYNNENNKDNINLPTPGEEIDYSQMERPTDNKKGRQFYRSVIESSNTTAEAKAVAKQLMKSDTYIPDSNLKQLQRADMNIEANGVDNSLETLKGKLGNGDGITATDIATSERLIEYYSKVGDKAKLQDAIQTSAMAGTEAGRTVQALSILNHSTPEGQVVWIQRSIDKLNDKLEKTKVKERFNFTPEMQQEILQATNQEEALNNVYKQLGQQVPMTTMQKLDSWRYFAMLGNPRTHIRNIVGNKVMGYIQQAKNQLAGTIEDIVLRNSEDRQFTTKIADKKTKEFAKADIENVLDRLGLTENKYNPKSRIEQNQKVFKSEFMNKTIGKLMEFNDMALEAEDGWGLKAMYPKALAQYITANNIDVDNITDTQLAKARNFAIKQAEEATFHQDNAIASAISQFEGKNNLTRFATGAILPFKKTPMNVAVEGIQYSPVGLLDSLTRGSINLRKGKINVHEYIDGISKGLTGTGIALLGYALTEAGILKASGGDDQDKNNFESAQGKQNYSLKVGEKTYSLDWLAPTGIPLFMGSELYQLASQKVKEKGEKNNTPEVAKSATKILNSMATAMNPLSEMSMISGLTSTLQSYASGNKGLENLGLNATKSYVGQFVPTVLGQVAKTFDDKERSTTSTESDPLPKALDTLGNQIKSKIPGLRQTLPTKTDIWGKDVGNEGNIIEKGLNAGVFPWSSKKISENNQTNKEISKLYDETLDKSVLPSNSIDKVLNIDKEKYRLSNEQYSKLKKMYGEINYKVLSELTSSPEYKEMNNEQKVKAISDIYKYSKAQIKSQYAQENDIDTEDSSILKSVKSIIYNGGKVDDYFKYVGMTTNAETTKEKADILEKSKLSDKTKEILYSSTIGKEDGIYNSLKDAININSYLNYKAQKIENKKELEEYLINSDMKSEEKVLLYATKYKVGEDDREYLYNYIKDLDIDTEQKTNIYRKIKGFKVVNDTIYY